VSTKKLPNIVIFNPDQWRGKDVGCLGNTIIRTPHTDRLADEGVAFSNCFVQNTVCVPSRCSFFTGWYPHVRGHRTMNHMLSPDEPFLLKQLKDQGYFVWWGGKNDVVRPEEQNNVCSLRYKPERGTVSPAKPPAMDVDDRLFYSHYRGKVADQPVVNNDDALVNGAIGFLRSNPPEPFCICLTLHDPHVPFQVDEPYFSMYDRNSLPPILPQPAEGTKSRHLTEIRDRMGLSRLEDADFKEILAVYYGMISKVDASLGRLTDVLKETGLWNDSAVFVFSDHGEYAGDYKMVEKSENAFDDDLTKVPLIVKYPARIPVPKRDKPVDALTELVDFYATVAELAELPERHTQFGKSLIPLSKGETTEHREQVFCEGGALADEPHTHYHRNSLDNVYWPRVSVQNDDVLAHGKCVMVRTKDWKYVKRLYEQDELYDLRNDPDELHNVIADPANRSVRRDMVARLARWYLETIDVVPFEPVLPKLEKIWEKQGGVKA
jgi:arylsulfatase A-like enzyme